MPKISATEIKANAVKAYGEFLDAGGSYADAMQAAAKALGGTPCSTFLGELAAIHAAKYKCNYTWDGQGRAVFYTGAESTRETRHDAARMSWTRNVMVWFTPEKPKAKVKAQRLSAETRQAAKDFLAMFDSLSAAKKALEAVAAK